MKAIQRRTFIKQSLAASAATLLTACTTTESSGPARLSTRSPGSKLNLAFIGVGGRGAAHVRYFAERENLVAFCDVDEERAAKVYADFPEVPRYRDFRVMLDQMGKQIDAVVVSTPDHTHFVATLACMERGIHVMTEKPLVRNIWQARALRQAALVYPVVTAMGNQGHATEGIRYIKEWYDAGVLGEVREVHAWFDGPDYNGPFFQRPDQYPLPATPVPPTLDWELWRGPVVDAVPYHPEFVPSKWRGHYVYGCGELGDWACHTLDGPNWALDLGAPVATELMRHETFFPTRYVPDRSIVNFEFAGKPGRPPVVLTWYDGGLKPALRPEWGLTELPGNGMIMVGSKATLMTDGRPNSPRLIPETDWEDFRRNLPPKVIPRVMGGHLQEWTNAIKGTGPTPGSDFDYASSLTELALVGVLAQRFGGRIEWDAPGMRITNRPDLNVHVKEPVRPGWEAGEGLWSAG